MLYMYMDNQLSTDVSTQQLLNVRLMGWVKEWVYQGRGQEVRQILSMFSTIKQLYSNGVINQLIAVNQLGIQDLLNLAIFEEKYNEQEQEQDQFTLNNAERSYEFGKQLEKLLFEANSQYYVKGPLQIEKKKQVFRDFTTNASQIFCGFLIDTSALHCHVQSFKIFKDALKSSFNKFCYADSLKSYDESKNTRARERELASKNTKPTQREKKMNTQAFFRGEKRSTFRF